jgi:phosphatidate cytidylyltransferase
VKRIATALVLLPILLFAVWSSIPYYFAGLAVIAALLALSEFYSLAAHFGCRPSGLIGYPASAGLIAVFLFERPEWGNAVVAIAAIAAITYELRRPAELKTALQSAAATLFGIIYIGLLIGYLVGVRAISETSGSQIGPRLAPKLLTMFFAMVMMTDTGAYYTGRAFGRHKLAPGISPGKTVEGAIGGLLTALATGPACKLIFFPELRLWDALVLGAIVGIVSQAGDLAESLLKRGAGVKDSSALIPGHGGMLDRLDSILFCAPLLYYYSRFLLAG